MSSDECIGECLGFQVWERRLANGLRILCVEDERAPVSAFQLWYGSGSAHDAAGRSGSAHFLEHLGFRSLDLNLGYSLDQRLESLGAEANAATWIEWTQYHALVPASLENLSLLAEVEAQRMSHFDVSQELFETERRIILAERGQAVDDEPSAQAGETLYQHIFPSHPYGSPTIGTLEDLRRIDLEAVESFHRTHYVPSNAVAIHVGQLAPDAAADRIAAAFEHIAASPAPETLPTPALPKTPLRHRLDRQLREPYVLAAWCGIGLSQAQRLSLEAALRVWSTGETARLTRRLVDKEGVANAVDANLTHLGQASLLEVWLDVDSAEAGERALVSLEQELGRLAPEGAPLEAWELGKAVNTLKVDLLHAFSTAEDLAEELAHDALVWDDPLRGASSLAATEALTGERVREAMKHLAPEGHQVIIT